MKKPTVGKTTLFYWVTWLPSEGPENAYAAGKHETLQGAQADCKSFAKKIAGQNAEHRIYRELEGKALFWRATGPRARNWVVGKGKPFEYRRAG